MSSDFAEENETTGSETFPADPRVSIPFSSGFYDNLTGAAGNATSSVPVQKSLKKHDLAQQSREIREKESIDLRKKKTEDYIKSRRGVASAAAKHRKIGNIVAGLEDAEDESNLPVMKEQEWDVRHPSASASATIEFEEEN